MAGESEEVKCGKKDFERGGGRSKSKANPGTGENTKAPGVAWMNSRSYKSAASLPLQVVRQREGTSAR